MKIRTGILLGLLIAVGIKNINKKPKNLGPCSPEMEDILERRRQGEQI